MTDPLQNLHGIGFDTNKNKVKISKGLEYNKTKSDEFTHMDGFGID